MDNLHTQLIEFFIAVLSQVKFHGGGQTKTTYNFDTSEAI